ncbi:MAG: hypothetical protein J5U17_11690 [Candidatus Methanoperedens sp.]|nr:hypothetical protein [Candidatus Methanoperedens sp.]MCE8429088.1 hypothetical protein [Candidatus Methanoperedens sp.]
MKAVGHYGVKIALEYLETYRHTCEFFYQAVKKFSKSILELKYIGHFDLTRMKTSSSIMEFMPFSMRLGKIWEK